MTKDLSTAAEIWGKACQHLRGQFSAEICEQWFDGLVPVAASDNSLLLGVGDGFFLDWLRENYHDSITTAARQAAGSDIEVDYEAGHDMIGEAGEPDEKESPSSPSVSPGKRQSAGGNGSQVLNHRFTFANFVVGEENRYAYTAAVTAAKTPGSAYNPLYIYGGNGLGKTHLLQAVCNDAYSRFHGAVIEFVTCENFLNLYVDSIRTNTHSDFRGRFRNVDILLIDDVHQLAGKAGLQEEFFNTFNNLHHNNKQIIMTSDKQPCEIAGLEKRLVSRFESGLTVEITPPGLETRLAILKMKQESQLIKLKDDVLYFIAVKIGSSIRRLEGALNNLVVRASLIGDMTVELAEDILGTLIEEESFTRKVSPEVIQKRVAEHFDLRVADILGSKRPKNIAVPRMIAMHLCRELTDMSTTDIGEVFGGRNHATVIHAHRKIHATAKSDPDLRRSLSLIKSKLSS